MTPATPIAHTIEKINGGWYVWRGNPPVLRTQDAIAGPYAKRYQVLEVSHLALMAHELGRES